MSALVRVLVVAHGHPQQSPGGGEIAALNLHRVLQADKGFKSMLLARSEAAEPAHPGTPFRSAGRPGEVLLHSHTCDRFHLSQDNDARVWRDFRDVLATFRPHIVHFHHYLHLGLEMLGEVKRFDASTHVLLTLHDYVAICHQHGQMIHPRTNALCHEATPEACSGCFRHYNPLDFALRKQWIQSWFMHVDQFIAPSQFLADRYIQWGLTSEQVKVMENLLESAGVEENEPVDRAGGQTGTAEADAEIPAVALGVGAHPVASNCARLRPALLRLAYFGRVAHTKGVDILLAAMNRLPAELKDQVTLDIHGTGLERLPWTDRRRLKVLARPLGKRVRFSGAYDAHDMPGLMAGVDWMVMPSRWWENSPVVILEAKRAGVPVICSDIGGMAEKVRDGDTGLHFTCGSAESLAATIVRAASLGARREAYAARIKADYQGAQTRQAHIALHRQVLNARPSVPHLGVVAGGRR